MTLISIGYLFVGSFFGLALRIFLNKNIIIKKRFFLSNTTFVNFLASLFLGILEASNSLNNNLFLLLYIGFLGCFSTFSSFIYELYLLLRKERYISFLKLYLDVIVLSLLFFYLGYYLTKVFY